MDWLVAEVLLLLLFWIFLIAGLTGRCPTPAAAGAGDVVAAAGVGVGAGAPYICALLLDRGICGYLTGDLPGDSITGDRSTG